MLDKQEQCQAQKNSPEPFLFRERDESNHRIANSLSIVSTLLRMQRRRSDDELVKQALLTAEARIAGIAEFHRYLYKHGSQETIDLAEFLRGLCPAMSASIGVDCHLVLKSVEVESEMAMTLGIIINELALNAVKHAYDEEESGWIEIKSQYDEDSELRITVADGGKGLPDGFDPSNGSGLGFAVISSLLHQFGGSLHAENNGGAQFTIAVPLDNR